MKKNVSVAIISDLHFSSDKDASRHTHSTIQDVPVPSQDPLNDLYALIEREGMSADVLLTPGDLANMSCGAGLRSAWAAIQQIGTKLRASEIIATTGNHDVKSRDVENAPDIWEALQQLSPTYPAPNCDDTERMRYWADHFLCVEFGWIKFFSLNTCNTHARGEQEYEVGRVTEFTITKLMEHALKGERKPLNVLLCHHHPTGLPELHDRIKEYSEMRHGPKLLSALERSGLNWIVVHGHKHFPNVDYAKGGADSPVVFSAGSFSAVLPDQFLATSTNQFYVLELDADSIESRGVCGIVRAWDWTKGAGWHRADRYDAARPDRIIYGSGFGTRVSASEMARAISEVIGDAASIDWANIVAAIPAVDFMRTADRVKLLENLKRKFGFHSTSRDPTAPEELVRRSS